ncbi:MAG TPA: type II CAAX endopeptidase family protein [Solirubrobacteraceae bacterium]|nr:type II CAAX endopeptidase family protein [Solirubrobacteraceae bacterium]
MPSVPPPRLTSTGPPAPPPPAQQQPEPGRPDDEVTWPIWTAPAAIGVGLVVGVFASLLVAAVAGEAGSTNPSPAVSLISDLVFDAGFVVTALYFASTGGRRPQPWQFGYRRIPLSLGFGAFALGAVGYYVVTALYQSVVNLHGTDKLPQDLGVGTSTAALIGAAVFVIVIAPIAEEFFFRGFLFGTLRRWHIKIAGRDIGTWVAAIITGIVFGLAHTGSADAQYLIPLGFLGFVLCLIRWKTGSLYPCMALHSVNNSLALGVNQLHWNGGEIVALIAGGLAVVGAITLPLASRSPAPAS